MTDKRGATVSQFFIQKSNEGLVRVYSELEGLADIKLCVICSRFRIGLATGRADGKASTCNVGLSRNRN